jgi:hypothetical protein
MFFSLWHLNANYNSKQQRKSGNESTLKKLNTNTFRPFVLNYAAKTLLAPGCRRLEIQQQAKKMRN